VQCGGDAGVGDRDGGEAHAPLIGRRGQRFFLAPLVWLARQPSPGEVVERRMQGVAIA
jgi:hypothetical protein